MDLEGRQTARQVGPVDDDAAVEPAGAEQSLVQDFGPVGGGQQDDALGGVKAVHLRQQLVQGLLPLVVAAHAVVAGFADGVDLIDEHDAGGHLAGLLEQVADTGSAHAHEHLHKVRAGDGEEGHVGLAGHSLGQQGLAGARRAHQQRALGQLGADLGVLSGIVQEVDDLRQGFLGLVLAGYVGKGDAGGLFHIHLGVGLAHAADAADTAHAALFGHPVHEQAHAQQDDDKGQEVDEEDKNGAHGRLVLGDDLGTRRFQPGDGGVIGLRLKSEKAQSGLLLLADGVQVGVEDIAVVVFAGFGIGDALAVRIGVAVLRRDDQDGFSVVKGNGFHLTIFHHIQEVTVYQLHGGGLAYAAGHVCAGVADKSGQQHRPADQGDDAPPVAAGFASAGLVGLVLVVLVHV